MCQVKLKTGQQKANEHCSTAHLATAAMLSHCTAHKTQQLTHIPSGILDFYFEKKMSLQCQQ